MDKAPPPTWIPPENLDEVSVWGLNKYILPKRLATGEMSGWFSTLYTWQDEDGTVYHRKPTEDELTVDAMTSTM